MASLLLVASLSIVEGGCCCCCVGVGVGAVAGAAVAVAVAAEEEEATGNEFTTVDVGDDERCFAAVAAIEGKGAFLLWMFGVVVLLW